MSQGVKRKDAPAIEEKKTAPVVITPKKKARKGLSDNEEPPPSDNERKFYERIILELESTGAFGASAGAKEAMKPFEIGAAGYSTKEYRRYVYSIALMLGLYVDVPEEMKRAPTPWFTLEEWQRLRGLLLLSFNTKEKPVLNSFSPKGKLPPGEVGELGFGNPDEASAYASILLSEATNANFASFSSKYVPIWLDPRTDRALIVTTYRRMMHVRLERFMNQLPWSPKSIEERLDADKKKADKLAVGNRKKEERTEKKKDAKLKKKDEKEKAKEAKEEEERLKAIETAPERTAARYAEEDRKEKEKATAAAKKAGRPAKKRPPPETVDELKTPSVPVSAAFKKARTVIETKREIVGDLREAARGALTPASDDVDQTVMVVLDPMAIVYYKEMKLLFDNGGSGHTDLSREAFTELENRFEFGDLSRIEEKKGVFYGPKGVVEYPPFVNRMARLLNTDNLVGTATAMVLASLSMSEVQTSILPFGLHSIGVDSTDDSEGRDASRLLLSGYTTENLPSRVMSPELSTRIKSILLSHSDRKTRSPSEIHRSLFREMTTGDTAVRWMVTPPSGGSWYALSSVQYRVRGTSDDPFALDGLHSPLLLVPTETTMEDDTAFAEDGKVDRYVRAYMLNISNPTVLRSYLEAVLIGGKERRTLSDGDFYKWANVPLAEKLKGQIDTPELIFDSSKHVDGRILSLPQFSKLLDSFKRHRIENTKKQTASTDARVRLFEVYRAHSRSAQAFLSDTDYRYGANLLGFGAPLLTLRGPPGDKNVNPNIIRAAVRKRPDLFPDLAGRKAAVNLVSKIPEGVSYPSRSDYPTDEDYKNADPFSFLLMETSDSQEAYASADPIGASDAVAVVKSCMDYIINGRAMKMPGQSASRNRWRMMLKAWNDFAHETAHVPSIDEASLNATDVIGTELPSWVYLVRFSIRERMLCDSITIDVDTARTYKRAIDKILQAKSKEEKEDTTEKKKTQAMKFFLRLYLTERAHHCGLVAHTEEKDMRDFYKRRLTFGDSSTGEQSITDKELRAIYRDSGALGDVTRYCHVYFVTLARFMVRKDSDIREDGGKSIRGRLLVKRRIGTRVDMALNELYLDEQRYLKDLKGGSLNGYKVPDGWRLTHMATVVFLRGPDTVLGDISVQKNPPMEYKTIATLAKGFLEGRPSAENVHILTGWKIAMAILRWPFLLQAQHPRAERALNVIVPSQDELERALLLDPSDLSSQYDRQPSPVCLLVKLDEFRTKKFTVASAVPAEEVKETVLPMVLGPDEDTSSDLTYEKNDDESEDEDDEDDDAPRFIPKSARRDRKAGKAAALPAAKFISALAQQDTKREEKRATAQLADTISKELLDKDRAQMIPKDLRRTEEVTGSFRTIMPWESPVTQQQRILSGLRYLVALDKWQIQHNKPKRKDTTQNVPLQEASTALVEAAKAFYVHYAPMRLDAEHWRSGPSPGDEKTIIHEKDDTFAFHLATTGDILDFVDFESLFVVMPSEQLLIAFGYGKGGIATNTETLIALTRRVTELKDATIEQRKLTALDRLRSLLSNKRLNLTEIANAWNLVNRRSRSAILRLTGQKEHTEAYATAIEWIQLWNTQCMMLFKSAIDAAVVCRSGLSVGDDSMATEEDEDYSSETQQLISFVEAPIRRVDEMTEWYNGWTEKTLSIVQSELTDDYEWMLAEVDFISNAMRDASLTLEHFIRTGKSDYTVATDLAIRSSGVLTSGLIEDVRRVRDDWNSDTSRIKSMPLKLLCYVKFTIVATLCDIITNGRRSPTVDFMADEHMVELLGLFRTLPKRIRPTEGKEEDKEVKRTIMYRCTAEIEIQTKEKNLNGLDVHLPNWYLDGVDDLYTKDDTSADEIASVVAMVRDARATQEEMRDKMEQRTRLEDEIRLLKESISLRQYAIEAQKKRSEEKRKELSTVTDEAKQDLLEVEIVTMESDTIRRLREHESETKLAAKKAVDLEILTEELSSVSSSRFATVYKEILMSMKHAIWSFNRCNERANIHSVYAYLPPPPFIPVNARSAQSSLAREWKTWKDTTGQSLVIPEAFSNPTFVADLGVLSQIWETHAKKSAWYAAKSEPEKKMAFTVTTDWSVWADYTPNEIKVWDNPLYKIPPPRDLVSSITMPRFREGVFSRSECLKGDDETLVSYMDRVGSCCDREYKKSAAADFKKKRQWDIFRSIVHKEEATVATVVETESKSEEKGLALSSLAKRRSKELALQLSQLRLYSVDLLHAGRPDVLMVKFTDAIHVTSLNTALDIALDETMLGLYGANAKEDVAYNKLHMKQLKSLYPDFSSVSISTISEYKEIFHVSVAPLLNLIRFDLPNDSPSVMSYPRFVSGGPLDWYTWKRQLVKPVATPFVRRFAAIVKDAFASGEMKNKGGPSDMILFRIAQTILRAWIDMFEEQLKMVYDKTMKPLVDYASALFAASLHLTRQSIIPDVRCLVHGVTQPLLKICANVITHPIVIWATVGVPIGDVVYPFVPDSAPPTFDFEGIGTSTSDIAAVVKWWNDNLPGSIRPLLRLASSITQRLFMSLQDTPLKSYELVTPELSLECINGLLGGLLKRFATECVRDKAEFPPMLDPRSRPLVMSRDIDETYLTFIKLRAMLLSGEQHLFEWPGDMMVAIDYSLLFANRFFGPLAAHPDWLHDTTRRCTDQIVSLLPFVTLGIPPPPLSDDDKVEIKAEKETRDAAPDDTRDDMLYDKGFLVEAAGAERKGALLWSDTKELTRVLTKEIPKYNEGYLKEEAADVTPSVPSPKKEEKGEAGAGYDTNDPFVDTSVDESAVVPPPVEFSDDEEEEAVSVVVSTPVAEAPLPPS
jgi:hypothetical protein